MPAKFISVLGTSGLALLLLMAGVPGCTDNTPSDFKAYNELDRPETNPVGETEDPAPGELQTAENAPVPVVDAAPDATTTDATNPEPEPSSANGAATEVVATATGTTAGPAAESSSTQIHGDVPAIAEKPLPEEEVAAEPRKVEVLIKDHEFSMEGGHQRVSYDDIDLLRVLNMEPVTPNAPDLMPKWLRDLDGKRVRIRGFMYPPFEETGIERFVLARDNQICCFGRNPKVYDLIDVQMRPGVSTHYIQNRPFDVTGVFHIAPVADPDLLQLYSIDDAQVIER